MKRYRKLATFCMAMAVVAVLVQPSVFSKEKPKTITVKGEILDTACYFNHGARGKDHKKCAVTCAKKGIPMGIIAEDGTVYLLNEDHQNAEAYESLKSLAGETVTVKGNLVEKDEWKILFVTKVL